MGEVNKIQRIEYIDFLKFIGLTCIIIAHVSAPDWLMAVRSFDVPFMVIISAILGAKSYRKSVNNGVPAYKYYFSRFERLVIPAWIFLVIYFGVYFVLSGERHTVEYYLASFALTRYGIGYVWVILVYMYSAFMIPLFCKAGLSKYSVSAVTVLYVLYELAYYLQIGTDSKLIDTTFYYIIPYGVITFMGVNYSHITKKHRRIITAVSFAVFVALAVYYRNIYGRFKLVRGAKYPPRIYYLSYGVALSFALLCLCENLNLKIYRNPFVSFVARNSLWIYLWHVFTLSAYNFLELPEIWCLKLIAIYLSAVIIVFVKNRVLDIIEKILPARFWSYLKG